MWILLELILLGAFLLYFTVFEQNQHKMHFKNFLYNC